MRREERKAATFTAASLQESMVQTERALEEMIGCPRRPGTQHTCSEVEETQTHIIKQDAVWRMGSLTINYFDARGKEMSAMLMTFPRLIIIVLTHRGRADRKCWRGKEN